MKIIGTRGSSQNLLNLQSLARCFGIDSEFVEVQALHSLKQSVPSGECVVVDLKGLPNTAGEIEDLAALLLDRGALVLLLATCGGHSANRVLQAFTGGAVRSVEAVCNATRVRFPPTEERFSGDLSSQSYSRSLPRESLGLTIRSREGIEILMTVNDAPTFVHMRIGRSRVFVWSTLRIFDVFQRLAEEKEFEDAVEEYVPPILFLRSVFGDRCWNNPHSAAGLVIDDPLLRKRYGFINFIQLLESARKHRYHVNLAFIPWNYWRTKLKQARQFRDHADCFSICVHGCDHTRNEYGSSDYAALLVKNFVARERMERHHQITGLKCEPVMVCPQERYSLEAMRAFADSRQFLAIANTACIARDLPERRVCAADLLLPAQDAFFGIPVFKRHYAADMSAFAMALFLGKPAILVEHHEFFRGGPAGVEQFVSELANLHPGVQWMSLLDIVTRTHLRRRIAKGRYELRIFTDEFRFEHSSMESAAYRLLRKMPDTTAIRCVRVNGEMVPFYRENGFLIFEIHVDKPQTVTISIGVAVVRPAISYSAGLKYQASVAVRRVLSELRDNVVARNPFALKAARSLMKLFKQTAN